MNRARNLSPTTDRFDRRRETVFGLLAVVQLICCYFGTVAAMRAVLVLGWYVS